MIKACKGFVFSYTVHVSCLRHCAANSTSWIQLQL